MTNKLKYFIGNWKMFGDFNDFKIVSKINSFSHKHKKTLNINDFVNLNEHGVKKINFGIK